MLRARRVQTATEDLDGGLQPPHAPPIVLNKLRKSFRSSETSEAVADTSECLTQV